MSKLADEDASELQSDAARGMMQWSRAAASAAAAAQRDAAKPKEIIKEGLSEYFIFTDRRHRDDPQRLVEADARASKPTKVPLKIQYRYRPARVRRAARAHVPHDQRRESKLGTTPLPDGVVRVFRDNGRDGLSYLDAAADQVHPDRRQDRAEPRAPTRRWSSS